MARARSPNRNKAYELWKQSGSGPGKTGAKKIQVLLALKRMKPKAGMWIERQAVLVNTDAVLSPLNRFICLFSGKNKTKGAIFDRLI